MDKEYLYVLYDGRYPFDPDRASVLTTADTKKEAFEESKDWPDDSLWVKYEIGKDNNLINGEEMWEWKVVA